MKIVFNSEIPINTFGQTYENEIINRDTNGVMSVSNLIPPQLKEFVQSLPSDKLPIELWGDHD